MKVRVLFSKVGKVYLVGAGPGDPELLTVKGLRYLQRADVIVYDRLVDRRVLALAPAGAERVSVRKKGGRHSFPQGKINEMLVARAREGKQVVRLKGGDPFVFGRGGEEALYLAQKKIPYEVVPGVSSALAVPASVGIPVTYRNLASSVTIVTGYQPTGCDEPVRWDVIARASDTLVVLMPLQNLRHIISQLILHGRALGTPAVLIHAGTLETQRYVSATLQTIVAKSTQAGIRSPALLVIGEVVRLAESLGKIQNYVHESSLLKEQISAIGG